MKSYKFIVTILVLLFTDVSKADQSCMTRMKYLTNLTAPSLESWATASLLQPGTSETECALTSQLVDLFSFLQDSIAQQNPDKHKLRGTHAKGTCVSGTFETQFDPRLTTKQKEVLAGAGIFQSKNVLPAKFRFANASSRIEPDWKADVRALSIKVALPDGHEQDFAFNNVQRFELDSLDNFVSLMQMQKGLINGKIHMDSTGAPDKKSLYKYFLDTEGAERASLILAHLKHVGDMAKADSKWHQKYTNQAYWSTTAFAIDDRSSTTPIVERVVKFGALSCDRVPSIMNSQGISSLNIKKMELGSEVEARTLAETLTKSGAVKKSEDYLGESLLNAMKQQPVCYNLLVQFMDEQDNYLTKSTDLIVRSLVENPSIVWDGPVHIVG